MNNPITIFQPEKNLLGILVFLILLSFLPYIYLSYYNHPIADDFIFPTVARDNFWGTQIDHYLRFSGRYVSLIIQSLHPIYLSLDYIYWYKITPLLTIILYISVIAFYFREVLAIKNATLISAALLLVYLSNAPSLWQSLYWWASSTIFDYGNMAWLLGSALVFRLLKYKTDYDLLLIILLFLSYGFSELAAITSFISHIVLIVAFSRYGIRDHSRADELKNRALIILIACFLGFSSNMVAPGNLFKAGYSNTTDLYSAFRDIWGFDILGLILPFLQNILLLCLGSFLVGLSCSPAMSSRGLTSKVFMYVTVVTLFLIIFVNLWFLNFAMSARGDFLLVPERALNAIFFPAVLLLVTVILCIGSLAREKLRWTDPFYEKVKLVGILLILTGSFFGKNYLLTLDDILSGKIHNYSKVMDDRLKILSAAAGSGGAVVFGDQVVYPRSITSPEMSDLSSIPKSVNGKVLSGIFGVGLVSDNPVHFALRQIAGTDQRRPVFWLTSNPLQRQAVEDYATFTGSENIQTASTLIDFYKSRVKGILVIDINDLVVFSNLSKFAADNDVFIYVNRLSSLIGYSTNLDARGLPDRSASGLIPFSRMGENPVGSRDRSFSFGYSDHKSCDRELVELYHDRGNSQPDKNGFRILEARFKNYSSGFFSLGLVYVIDIDLPPLVTYVAHFSPNDDYKKYLPNNRKTFGFEDFSTSGTTERYCTVAGKRIRFVNINFETKIRGGALTLGLLVDGGGVISSTVVPVIFN